MADYLAQADAPPGRPASVGAVIPWTQDLARALDAADVPHVIGYPVGRHVVDLCAGGSDRFIGVETGVHPDGATAHIERRLSLMRAGWEMVEGHRSRWAEHQGELLVSLIGRLQR
jgi:hypothetical protein